MCARAFAAWGVCLGILLSMAASQEIVGVLGEVYIIHPNFTFDPFPDLPADFGPSIPEEGIEGYLRLADPEDACGPLRFSDYGSPWIALIARSQNWRETNCTFDIKVRNAELAGAAAAIVFDDAYESLVIMSKPRANPDPGIPSVFVSEKAGLIMKRFAGPETRVRLAPVSGLEWMSLVMSAFLGALALTVVVATFYVMRSWSVWLGRARVRRAPGEYGYSLLQGDEAGLTAAAIRALPVVVVDGRRPGSSCSAAAPAGQQPSSEAGSQKAGAGGSGRPGAAGGQPARGAGSSGSDSDEHAGLPSHAHAGATRKLCAICLEDYEPGEKVRVLPCLHRFHVACIDQWLHSRRLCPVCKHDTTKPLIAPPPRARTAPAGDEQGQSRSLGRAVSAMLGGVAWAVGQRSRRQRQQQQQQQQQRASSAPLAAPLLADSDEQGDVESGLAGSSSGTAAGALAGQQVDRMRQLAWGAARQQRAFATWYQRIELLRQQEQRLLAYLQHEQQHEQHEQHEQQRQQQHEAGAIGSSNDVD